MADMVVRLTDADWVGFVFRWWLGILLNVVWIGVIVVLVVNIADGSLPCDGDQSEDIFSVIILGVFLQVMVLNGVILALMAEYWG